MKDKKKKPTQQIVQKPLNKIRTIFTSDGKQYKILDSLLIKYSTTCRIMFDDDKNDQQLKLPGVHSTYFDYCVQFINNHKQKQPQKIHVPIKTNQQLKLVMEQLDAELVQKIMIKDELLKNVLEAANYLQMVDFQKRLIAGLAIKLTKYTVDQLKQMYQLTSTQLQINQELIRAQIREKLQSFNQNKEQSF